ncbi:hypothetical protein D3C77_462160 [compost metagenome]
MRRRHHGVESHVVVQADRIDGGVDVARRQQGRQGRGEAQALALFCEVQRLDAEAVARHHRSPAVALVQDEGEHPLEPLDAGLAPGLPGLDDDLRVALGEETVA